MKEVDQMIEKYGPKIAEALQTTAANVYPKLLWYIQVSGVKDLLEWASFIIASIFLIRAIRKPIKKVWVEDTSLACFCIFIGSVLWFFLYAFFITAITGSVIKVIFPEWWIIDQIVNKIGTH